MGRKICNNKGKEKRLARKEERQRVAAGTAAVARANALEDPLAPLSAFHKFQRCGLTANITCCRVAQLPSETFEWVVDLTERNMKKPSELCSWGWDAARKREELSEEAAWYLIAKDVEGKNLGFSHFRFDMDYGDEVLYCYELQLESWVQRRGLGSFLLHTLELIAFTNQMRKVVLTILLNNKPSINFFKALRYTTDETNPDEDEDLPYQILSKLNPKMNRPLCKAPPKAATKGTTTPCCQGGHHN